MRRARFSSLTHLVLMLFIGLSALALRLAVPAGFMPALDQGRLALTPCPAFESFGGLVAKPAGEPGGDPAGGMKHHRQEGDGSRGSCAFADLSLPAIGGSTPLALASAIVFFAFVGLFTARALPLRGPLRLRPPLRAPPLPR